MPYMPILCRSLILLRQRPKYFQASHNSSTGRIKRIIVTEAQTDYIWNESSNYGVKSIVPTCTFFFISCTDSSKHSLFNKQSICYESKICCSLDLICLKDNLGHLETFPRDLQKVDTQVTKWQIFRPTVVKTLGHRKQPPNVFHIFHAQARSLLKLV